MGEKKLYMYMNDTEYGKRLQRYLNVNRHPLLRVEMVTERDSFWNGRQQGSGKDEYWLTDDVSGAVEDRGDPASLMVLDDHTDERSRRFSCRMKAENICMVLLSAMSLELEAKGDVNAPMHGIYGVYAPWGEEGSVASALLSQRLAGYGESVFLNLSEFPVFYGNEDDADSHLGELFFRVDSPEFASVVTRAKKNYGYAVRLPGVSHYRDLWDIDTGDMDKFMSRLRNDCGFKYVVVLFNDVRGALPMADMMTGIFFVRRKSDRKDPYERWLRYAKTEKKQGQVRTVIMPSGWEGWIADMERETPERWLDDERKKEFIDAMWNESESS